MLKKLSYLISMPFMAVLLMLLIVVLALATFVESAFDTQTAWAIIYGTHWFELLLLLTGINLVGGMFKQKLFQRRKLVVLLFHLAFILILAGAAITRFISYEGTMHIRENEASNSILSNNAFIDLVLESGKERAELTKKVMLTELTPRDFRATVTLGDEKVKVRSFDYMANAAERYVSMPGGEPYLQLVLVTDQQNSIGIPSGTTGEVLGLRIAFNREDSTALLHIVSEGERIEMVAPFTVSETKMGGEVAKEYPSGEPVPIRQGTLYSMGHLRMALQNFMPSAKKQIVRAQAGTRGTHLGAVGLEIKYRGMVSEVRVPGLARLAGEPVTGSMGDLTYTITYGSREIALPFSLFLKDFEVERYPGSNSPSSFASNVVLIDKEANLMEDRRIFMNNVLKYRGYRFYQSSYDHDEMGTILSVNKDRAGTFVTYLGYFLLIVGMIAALFVRGTRFEMILKKSAAATRAAVSVILLLGVSLTLHAQEVPPGDVAREFGRLWVQDKGGRFEPMNTLSNEVVRKITRKSKLGGYSADQVLLGMIMYPERWQQKPLFRVKHPELHRILGYKGELVSFEDLMDSTGTSYLLSGLVNKAYSKQVALQSELDREVIKLDDRVNALYLVQSGSLLRIFPDPGAENHKWASVNEALMGHMTLEDDTISTIFLHYLSALKQGNYSHADGQLHILMQYQRDTEELLPPDSRKEMELLYNRVNIFPRLLKLYGIMGVILVVLQFLIIFKPRKLYNNLFTIGVIPLVAGFIVHTMALLIRWKISGHAPMSNGYESMIFVSLITMLAGFIFMKRSGYALALTAILSALALMVAGMSNMNPEITNLVPVLKSPWLTIHVAVIMAGYGFLGLASILGLLNVVSYVFLSPSNKGRMEEVIAQITRVNHLTLIIGLYFMTAGVFLGGVWANESWGRYWGWDPKETWALITVLIYAVVAHMHRIPGLRGTFAYNLASFVSFSAVLMTYFGVNFFLGGMHSYASGSAFSLPLWAYLIILLLTGMSVYAYMNQQKLLEEKHEH